MDIQNINNTAATNDLPMEEIQGLIVRGYNMKYVRHTLLAVTDPAKAKQFIGQLTDDQCDFHITNAQTWTKGKPKHCVNISFTYKGLQALQINGIDEHSFDTFYSFKEGAAKRAHYVGDRGESGPQYWKEGFQPNKLHILLTVWANEISDLEAVTEKLKSAYGTALKAHNVFDGQGFPDGKIHFGYKDGISQPRVFGFPETIKKKDGAQYPVPSWNFVLHDHDYQQNYLGQNIMPPDTVPPTPLVAVNAAPYKLPTPRQLGLWGGFAAFRMLEQDVFAFEEYLEKMQNQLQMDKELIAAKFCGRWRNGSPLADYPLKSGEDVPASQLNDFNYMHPDEPAANATPDIKQRWDETPKNLKNDLLGIRCPIGSHMRRNNPRNSPVDSDVRMHRIIRRGIPYGPMVKPGDQPDGKERGLLGLFIGACLESQFEFLMHNWVNTNTFAPDMMDFGGQKDGKQENDLQYTDPILGATDDGNTRFKIPKGVDYQDNTHVDGFPRFIKTRGGAYTFFPSISGLKYIAEN